MKNGLVIWNILLTLIAGYLLIAKFSSKGKAVASPVVQKDSSTMQGCRIAYFEMDSIEAHYEKVKDVQAEIQGKEKEYSDGISQLNRTYQTKAQEIYQQKGPNMSQADYEKTQMELKQLEDGLKGRKQDMDQQYQDFVTRRNLGLKKKIEDFIAKYNQDRKYSYIVVYEPGLFYFKDTAYNITADVIKGLNEDYKNNKD